MSLLPASCSTGYEPFDLVTCCTPLGTSADRQRPSHHHRAPPAPADQHTPTAAGKLGGGGGRAHMEALLIYKLGSRKFTAQNDLY